MSPKELREACSHHERITLKMPPKRLGGSDPPRRRLCGRRGPLGVVVCGGPKHHVVLFEAIEVLAFLDAAEAAERGE